MKNIFNILVMLLFTIGGMSAAWSEKLGQFGQAVKGPISSPTAIGARRHFFDAIKNLDPVAVQTYLNAGGDPDVKNPESESQMFPEWQASQSALDLATFYATSPQYVAKKGSALKIIKSLLTAGALRSSYFDDAAKNDRAIKGVVKMVEKQKSTSKAGA